ncbi:MAG: arylsulfotransferase family protein [bacterium]
MGPAFSKGNALISMRNTSTIAVVDLETETIVWSLAGPFSGQHDPVLLDNNNLLLFDNWGHRGYSKVIEMDPLTQEIAWAFYGSESNNFASKCCGSNQRLPNDNTLITDSTHGRSFEVTPEGRIVWDFYNPHRSPSDRTKIAALYDLKRYSPSYFDDWLRTGAAND